jgi:hypothetical protein
MWRCLVGWEVLGVTAKRREPFNEAASRLENSAAT